MRIAEKVDFARMYLTKSRLLEVEGTLNICLKPPTTFVLGHKYANVELERQKKAIKTPNCEIVQKRCYLQCFDRKPWFVDPPRESSSGLIWEPNTTKKHSSRVFDGV